MIMAMARCSNQLYNTLMVSRRVIIGYRFALGAAVIMALVAQVHSLQLRPSFSLVNFFSFFTVLSNVMAAAVFLLGSIWMVLNRKNVAAAGYDLLRGAITVYMVVTGMVYLTLLSGNEVALQTTLPWVNAILHYIMPVAVLADWLLVPPRTRLAATQIWVWLLFLAVYLVYSLVRGPMAQWYPYPFLDPGVVDGYGGVTAYAAGILVAILLTSLGILVAGNFARTKR